MYEKPIAEVILEEDDIVCASGGLTDGGYDDVF